jgi:6-phosphogluconolactonase
MKPEIITLPTEEEVARRAARDFVELAKRVSQERGRITCALAGGTTPRRMYELLAGDLGASAPWSEVVVTFGDERCVPREHQHSNQRVAREVLLDHVPIPEGNVMEPIGPEVTSEVTSSEEHQRLAAAYNEMLEDVVGTSRGLDWVLLGLGADGHTASLFPPAYEPPSVEPLVVPVVAPKSSPIPRRLSLSYGALRGATEVWVLVTGAAKAEVLARVAAGDGELPMSKVIRDRQFKVRLLVDQAAASRLPRE